MNRYRAACQYARIANTDNSLREQAAEKAIEQLEKAKLSGYFDTEMIDRLNRDSEFDGIRSLSKFTAFSEDLARSNNGSQILFK